MIKETLCLHKELIKHYSPGLPYFNELYTICHCYAILPGWIYPAEKLPVKKSYL